MTKRTTEVASAVRATGASWVELINYAIQRRVMLRLIGFSIHRLDINLQLRPSLNVLALA